MTNVIPEILPDVTQEIRDEYAKKIKISQPKSIWASKLGYPCERHLVHHQLDWEKKRPHGVDLEFIFNGGHVLERHIAKVYLEEAGYEIVEMDRSIQAGDSNGIFKKLNVNGKLDFIARKNGFEFPVEAKTMAPQIFNKIEAVEDMLKSKWVWTKSYPAQLMTYLLGKEYEIGMFILINKVNFQPRHVWVHQDYTYAEELLQKAERVGNHVKAGTYPDRIEYDESVCGKCEFSDVCLQGVVRKETDFWTDPDFEELLERREELRNSLKPIKSEFEDVDGEVKARLQNVEKAVIGRFLVTGKLSERKEFTVPASSSWRVNIKPFDKKQEDTK